MRLILTKLNVSLQHWLHLPRGNGCQLLLLLGVFLGDGLQDEVVLGFLQKVTDNHCFLLRYENIIGEPAPHIRHPLIKLLHFNISLAALHAPEKEVVDNLLGAQIHRWNANLAI